MQKVFLTLLFAILWFSLYIILQNINKKIVKRINKHNQITNFIIKQKKSPQKPEIVSLIAVGDVSLSRDVDRKMKQHKNLFYPFLNTKDYLKTGDIVFGNLECPITSGRSIHWSEMILRADPGVENILKEIGFTILSLANNHTPNFGYKGLRDTFNYLKKAEINFVGAGENIKEAYQPVYINKKGITFAFLAYNDIDVVPLSYGAQKNSPGTAFMSINKLQEAVKKSKEKADFIIVSMHSGYEYKENPNKSQIKFAHSAIDAGADLVIGHHPHIVQQVEKYKGKYIFYSLGNFIFDQMWSIPTRQGIILKTFFTKNGLEKFEFIPYLIEDYSQPNILETKNAENIFARLKTNLDLMKIFYWDKDKKTFVEKERKAIIVNKNNKKRKIKKIVEENNNQYILKNGKLKIIKNNKLFWKSPDKWWVDDFIIADSTTDGIKDINILLWKTGNFGSSKPFWIKKNDMSIKNHLFLLNLKKGGIKHIWGSSNLYKPIDEFIFEDIDNNGVQDLIVIEGEYNKNFKNNNKHIVIWEWKNWGFYNKWRSNAADYKDLRIEKINGNKYIIADVLP